MLVKEIIEDLPYTDKTIRYYYQVAGLLRRKIQQGELVPGTKLPRKLELEKIFGISRVPIRQALSILETDGLVLRKHG